MSARIEYFLPKKVLPENAPFSLEKRNALSANQLAAKKSDRALSSFVKAMLCFE